MANIGLTACNRLIWDGHVLNEILIDLFLRLAARAEKADLAPKILDPSCMN